MGINHGDNEIKITEVLAKVYDLERLQLASQQVRKNAGAASIAQMTVGEFKEREEYLLNLIHDKLSSGTYQFQPACRVEIPKAGTSKTKKLGIPVVIDRIVGTRMHFVLDAYFDPQVTDSSFSFRKGKSQHQTIWHLQALVNEEREWAVVVDLRAFFDEIPRDLILKLVHRQVADERFVCDSARQTPESRGFGEYGFQS